MRVGVLFDIPIRVHWSWLIGFVLLTWLIASGGLPFISINLTEAQEWIIAVIVTICLFLSVLAHELAHSLTAKRFGYSVVSITLMIFGGVSLIAELRKRSSHDFLIAAAGPAMSLVLGIVASLLYFVYRDPLATGGAAMVQGILFYVALQNIALAVFNMLPGLPLDGGRVLQSAVWGLTGDRRFAARVAGRARSDTRRGDDDRGRVPDFGSPRPFGRIVVVLDREFHTSSVDGGDTSGWSAARSTCGCGGVRAVCDVVGADGAQCEHVAGCCGEKRYFVAPESIDTGHCRRASHWNGIDGRCDFAGSGARPRCGIDGRRRRSNRLDVCDRARRRRFTCPGIARKACN